MFKKKRNVQEVHPIDATFLDGNGLADEVEIAASELAQVVRTPEDILGQDREAMGNRVQTLESKIAGLKEAIGILSNELGQAELSHKAYKTALGLLDGSKPDVPAMGDFNSHVAGAVPPPPRI